MYKADLHVHTKVSDCSEEISIILNQAREQGLTHIAFTDHDTTRLAAEHSSRAAAFGVKAVPALEMSACNYEHHVKAHILGYGYITTSHIEQIGMETLRKRNENCLKQMEILKKLGYRIDEEAIQKMAGTCIYKQHILSYLFQTGQTYAIFGDVYQNIFKNGGECDFDIRYPEPVECVKAICADGGVAVLAHPGQQDNFHLLPELVDAGLRGIEYCHPSHKEAERRRAEQAAKEYGLIMTGGSDYHGSYAKEKTVLGQYPAPESSRILFGG